jgi:nicotinamide mononucleotide (NMN) deamidase PncC
VDRDREITVPRIKRIIPILIGARSASISDTGVGFSSIFTSGVLSQLPDDLHPTASVALAKRLLSKYGVFFDEQQMNSLTVKSVVDRVMQNLGIDAAVLLTGNAGAAANSGKAAGQLLNKITVNLMKNIQYKSVCY